MRRDLELPVLAGVTAVMVIAAAWAVGERYGAVVLDQREGGRVFPDLQRQAASVSSVELARAEGGFSLNRQPEGWANMGAGGYPARQARIEKMIGGLVTLSYFEPKTARADLYPKLEVEDVARGASSTRVTVKDESGAVLADVIVGKAKTGVAGLDRDGVYVRLPGEERAWLAEGALDVRYDAADWSDRSVVDVRAGAVGFMSVTHADGEVVEIHRERADDADLTIRNLPPDAEIEHQYQIDYMSHLLDDVSFVDARRADRVDFREGSGFRATVVSTDGLVVMMRTAEPGEDDTVWAQFDADVAKEFEPTDEAREEAERIGSELFGWAFLLPRAKTERLRVRLDEIVGRKQDAGGEEG